mmetsp:Transcript_1664/g.4025  ORF Transcript_1664/g.4025 Transcript_1664/m.4025 type:complete len:85 (+) Transcript_1664:641-895(+)
MRFIVCQSPQKYLNSQKQHVRGDCQRKEQDSEIAATKALLELYPVVHESHLFVFSYAYNMSDQDGTHDREHSQKQTKGSARSRT